MFRLEKSSEPSSFQELPHGKEQTRGKRGGPGRSDRWHGLGIDRKQTKWKWEGLKTVLTYYLGGQGEREQDKIPKSCSQCFALKEASS